MGAEPSAGAGMHLPSQLFAEVVEALRDEAAGTSGQERRTATRMEVQTPIHVAHYRNGLPDDDITVLTRDVSIGGVGLLQAYALQAEELMVVRLPRLAKPPIVMLGRATYCRRLGDDLYSVGVAFIRELRLGSEPQVAQEALDQIRQRILE